MHSDAKREAYVEGMTETVEVIPSELHEGREGEQNHSNLEEGKENPPQWNALPSSLLPDQEAHVIIFNLVLSHYNIITPQTELSV